MKALVIEKQGAEAALRIQEVDDPVPGAGEALIKVRLAGICRTDQELARGYMDFSGVPGHEFVGEVVGVEAGERFMGRRVVGEINCGCGTCSWCACGLERHCPERSVLGISGRDGAFAEYLTLPLKNLHLVPDDLDDEAAVFIEPVAAALEIFEQIRIRPNQKVLVIGDGKLGLLVSRVLQIHGCDVTCLGLSDWKLKLLEEWGIASCCADDFSGGSYDLAVEASGAPDGFKTALSSLRPRGTLVLKSTYAGDLTLNAAPIVVDEINVLGSRCGPFAPALRLLGQGLIPTEQLITARYPFADALNAFERAADPEALKVLLRFS